MRLSLALLMLIGAVHPASAETIDDSISGVIHSQMRTKDFPPHNQPYEKKHPDIKKKAEIWDMDGPSPETDGINGR